uniref:Uncharacterized protein n=1 Tax=Opuntia streptacantha TaxID=393608 RepID=A0A7C8YQR8_OPUST
MKLLSRLRRAVRKLTFLLNLKKYINQSSWRFVSLLSRARAPAAKITGQRWRRRALSFNDRPGLRACVDLDAPDDDHHHENVELEGSSGGSSPLVLRRTTSCPSPSEEDIHVDERAEKFIAWFREQLSYERQISLRLRYVRGYSFEEGSSSNDTNVSPLSSFGSHLVSPT